MAGCREPRGRSREVPGHDDVLGGKSVLEGIEPELALDLFLVVTGNAILLQDGLNVLGEIHLLGKPLAGLELFAVGPIGAILDPVAKDLLLGLRQGIILFRMLDGGHEQVVVDRKGSGPVEGAVLRFAGDDELIGGKGRRLLVQPDFPLGVVRPVTAYAVVLENGLYVPDELHLSGQAER